jgi:phage-related protein
VLLNLRKIIPRQEILIWTFCPDNELSASYERKIYEANFGDGYRLRLSNGINNIHETWSATFSNRKQSELLEMQAFLNKAGAGAFDYAPPGMEPIRVICDTWDLNMSGRLADGTIYGGLKATFSRVWGI